MVESPNTLNHGLLNSKVLSNILSSDSLSIDIKDSEE
jgi:hypothetical protein